MPMQLQNMQYKKKKKKSEILENRMDTMHQRQMLHADVVSGESLVSERVRPDEIRASSDWLCGMGDSDR